MSALLPESTRAMREQAAAASDPVTSLLSRWQSLHRSADELAGLGGLASGSATEDVALFEARVADAAQWQRDLAWRGIEDIEAMMQPGLAALRTLTARGQDASAPALALWREFYRARTAVVTSLKPHEETVTA